MHPQGTEGMIRAVIPVFELFREVQVALGLAGGIFAMALLTMLWFVFAVARPHARALRALTREAAAYRRPTDFAASFSAVEKRALAGKITRGPWRKLRETLILPPEGKEGVVRQTIPVSHFFNLSAAETAGAGFKHYAALPNYFVGVGLVFTFLGLVAALYFASGAVASQNVAEAQAALGDLLRAATFKFSTSIAGLASSLLLSIIVRLMTQEAAREYARLCETLEERMELVTPLRAAMDQLSELKRQSAGMAALPAAIADAVERRFSESLPAMLEEAIAPVSQSIELLARSMGDADLDRLSSLVSDFQSNLTQHTGREMDALADTMADMRDVLRNLSQNMAQAGGKFGDRMEGAAAKMESLTSNAGKQMAEQFSGMVEQLAGASKPLIDLAGRLTEAGRGIGQAVTMLAKANEQTTGLTTALTQSAEALKGGYAEHRGRFEEIDKKLADAFKVFAQGTDAHRRNVEDFVRGLDEQFEKALGSFANAVDELNRSVDGLERTMRAGAAGR